jgi:F0F1-type ATP synthase alpha subunit
MYLTLKEKNLKNINSKNFCTQSESEIKTLIFNAKHFGKVIKIKDGVAFVINLRNVTFGELVLFIPSVRRLKKYKENNNKP